MMVKEMSKSLPIGKWMVFNSYLKVIVEDGSVEIAGQSIEQFHENLSGNLNKIWNRMTSGSYFPPPARRSFSGKHGGKRLDIPTVSDRIAQGVVKDYLEPSLEKIFHSSSFGYRPGKSAHEAFKQTLDNCIKYGWAINVNIKGFFDNISHDIMLQLLQQHAQEKWILLYAERWLKAGVKQKDGSVAARSKGILRGGVVSSLLANIYLHHCFDKWMDEVNMQNPFERYGDDIVIHCSGKEEARQLLEKLKVRMQQYELELHPEKTKMVYCKNYQPNDKNNSTRFTFLGYSFLPGIMSRFGRKNRMVVFNAAKTTIRAKLTAVFMA
jgi:RNA-directed DNA polymerase